MGTTIGINSINGFFSFFFSPTIITRCFFLACVEPVRFFFGRIPKSYLPPPINILYIDNIRRFPGSAISKSRIIPYRMAVPDDYKCHLLFFVFVRSDRSDFASHSVGTPHVFGGHCWHSQS